MSEPGVYIAAGTETWQVGNQTLTLTKGDSLTIPPFSTPVRRVSAILTSPVQYHLR